MSKYAGKLITNQAPAGYSVFFDGASDYLSLAANAAFAFGTGDFTVEFWVYYASASANYIFYDGRGTSISNTGVCIFISGGVIYVNKGTAILVLATSPTASAWHHIAFSRSGSSNKLFVDGAQVGSTATDSTNYSTNYSVGIGAPLDPTYTAGYSLNGYLSNVRVVKGTAVYTSDFTPPTQLFPITNTSLLTCQSPSIIDNSSNAFAITTNGNAAVSTFTPFTAYNPYNPALGASTPGVWTLDEAMQAAATRQWNMYDPSFQNTTLLLHGNGTNGAQNNTFLDSSSNNFTITRNGNTTQGTFSPFSQTGWSNFFDGTGDFLTAVGANLALGTGDFTIEFWFYAAAYSSAVDTSAMFDSRSGNNTTGFLIGPVFNNTNTLNVVQNTSPILTANTTYPLNTWVHCAVVRSSGTITLYQNGVSVGAVANTTNNTATTNYIASGYWQPSGSGQMFNGYLSNLRISNTARYTANFTPSASAFSSDSNTRLLACQSNRFLDSSSNAYPITPYGTPSVQAFSPFYPTAAYTPQTIGGSGYFDGSGDYLDTGVQSNLYLNASDYTIEFWAYFTRLPGTANSGTQQTPLTQGDGAWFGNNNEHNWVVLFDVNTFYFGKVPNSYQIAYTPPVNTWIHYAIVGNASGSITLYINGVSQGTQTGRTALGSASWSTRVGLGFYGDTKVANYFQGYMSGVRIVKGTQVYTGNFTPPTAPLSAITNTQLLLNYTNAGIVDSTAKNALETAGNAQISTAVSKFGGSSMYFDGTGDYLRIQPSDLLATWFNSDYTIEYWVYPNAFASSVNGGSNVYSQSDPASGSEYFSFGPRASGVVVWYYYNGATQIVTSGTISTGVWTHLAWTYQKSSNTMRIFINGVLNTTTTIAGTPSISTTANPILVGASTTVGFNGYIDDLRVTKGVARYTANFTPQTSQWQDQ